MVEVNGYSRSDVMKRLELDNGKYTILMPENMQEYYKDGNRFECLRYGEQWRDLTGDNLVLALCERIWHLEETVNKPA